MNTALKIAILKSGLKQIWIAQKAEMDPALLSHVISGTRKPTEDQKDKLSEILGIPVESLFNGGDEDAE